jgi:hypothetical protein
MNGRIAIFGSQNGSELVARVRYQEGYRAVPTDVADQAAKMTVPEAVTFMAEMFPAARFVDLLPANESFCWEDAYLDDAQNGIDPTDGVYTVVAVSRIQPAATVRVTVPGDSVETTRLMFDESGQWETVSFERPTADEMRAYNARYYTRK